MRVVEHPLTAGLPPCWRGPQTRYNDLPEQVLLASGYQILSRIPDVGADMFIKEKHSLFLFLQGHPEYDPETLLQEYRRDIGRFLKGERATYPDPVHGYFDEATAAALDSLREQALRTREPSLLDLLPETLAEWAPPHDWRGPATRIYANWLLYLAQRRDGDAAALQPCGATAES